MSRQSGGRQSGRRSHAKGARPGAADRGLRVGVLGGTFNPVHHGHLALAEHACDALRLDHVLLVPCRIPPLKSSDGVVEARHRLAMLRAAVRGNPRLRVSTVELRREGTSYTVDTMTWLHRRLPGARLFFIAGADVLPSLPGWKSIDELMTLCRFVVATRGGVRRRIPAFVTPLSFPLLDISSRDVRQLIRRGRSVRYLVPDAVCRYIRRHRLYGARGDETRRGGVRRG